MAARPDTAAAPAVAQPRADLAVTPVAASRSADYGGLVSRALAAAVDAAVINLVAIVVAAVVALILSIFPVGHNTRTALAAIGGVLFFVWAAGYFVVFWTTTGQTPGDRTMRLRVVRLDATRLRVPGAIVRLVGAVLGLVLLIGYIPILLTEHRRALHDFMAGTVVIVAKPDPARTRGTIP